MELEQRFCHEKLFISQPAISQHVRMLEQRFDVKLFDRTNKYVRLTKAGEVFYHHAKEILSRYEQMDRLIKDLKEEASGPLYIGASFTFGEYVLPHLLAEFRRRYAKITPMIAIDNTETVASRVADGELDIGIVEGKVADDKNVDVFPFAEDTVVIVGCFEHSLAMRTPISVEQLEDVTWIIRERGSGTREIADHFFRTCGFVPKSVVEYGSSQMIKESVEAGLGLALLSKWIVRKELMWNRLSEIRYPEAALARSFSIVVKKTNFKTKATQLFEAFLHEQAPRINQLLLAGL